MRLSNRGRLLLRTPGPVPFGTCIFLMLRPFFPELVMSTDLLSFERPRYFYFAYKYLNVCHFDYTAFAVSGKVGHPRKRCNHTSWMTVVTQADRPKSVRNRCVIEVFGGVFVCPLVFEFSVGIGVIVIGLSQSDLLLFLFMTFKIYNN